VEAVQLGENVTTAGLDQGRLPLGSLLHLGPLLAFVRQKPSALRQKGQITLSAFMEAGEGAAARLRLARAEFYSFTLAKGPMAGALIGWPSTSNIEPWHGQSQQVSNYSNAGGSPHECSLRS
jgi:hypothetical protein